MSEEITSQFPVEPSVSAEIPEEEDITAPNDPTPGETEEPVSKVETGLFLTDRLARMRQVSLTDVGVALPETYGRMFLTPLDERGAALSIPISLEQASQLAATLRGVKTPRPLSHALFMEIATAFDVRLELVSITGVQNGNYVAEVIFSGSGSTKTFPARPSDAVLLATLSEVPIPIMVDEALLAT